MTVTSTELERKSGDLGGEVFFCDCAGSIVRDGLKAIERCVKVVHVFFFKYILLYNV